MGSLLSHILEDIQSEETTSSQRCKAFEALFLFVNEAYTNYWDNFYDEDESRERIMIVCLDEVKYRVTSNDSSRISNQKLGRLILYNMSNRAIDRFVNDESAFLWILNVICNGDNDDHLLFSSILAQFASASVMGHRATVIVRYFNSLKAAFNAIFSRCVVSVDTIKEFFQNYDGCEMAGLFAVLHSAFARWVLKTTQKDKTEVCDIITQVLKVSLDSPVTLRNLLGEDLLSISAHLSALPSNEYDGIDHADLFRSILDLYPQFRQQFRKWTANGIEDNPIAELGRTIPPKDLSRQAEYVFYEENEE